MFSRKLACFVLPLAALAQNASHVELVKVESHSDFAYRTAHRRIDALPADGY